MSRLGASVLDSAPSAVTARPFAFPVFVHTRYWHHLLLSVAGYVPWETDSEIAQQKGYWVALSGAPRHLGEGVGGRTEQRAMPGCEAVSQVAQLILEGAWDGARMALRRKGTEFLYPHIGLLLATGYPRRVVTVSRAAQQRQRPERDTSGS